MLFYAFDRHFKKRKVDFKNVEKLSLE